MDLFPDREVRRARSGNKDAFWKMEAPPKQISGKLECHQASKTVAPERERAFPECAQVFRDGVHHLSEASERRLAPPRLAAGVLHRTYLEGLSVAFRPTVEG